MQELNFSESWLLEPEFLSRMLYFYIKHCIFLSLWIPVGEGELSPVS